MRLGQRARPMGARPRARGRAAPLNQGLRRRSSSERPRSLSPLGRQKQRTCRASLSHTQVSIVSGRAAATSLSA